MEPEARPIIRSMTGAVKRKIAGLVFTKGKIGNASVVIGCGAYGKVSAAICAEILIMKYGAAALINSGVGGGLDPSLEIGDTVVATGTVQHDYDTSPLGDPVGMISGINLTEIKTDPDISDRLFAAAISIGAPVRRGVIATGDRFVADSADGERIAATFGAVACEMEGGSVGQAAYMNEVPFAVLRAISDNGNGKAAEDFPAFTEAASERAAKILVTMINDMERKKNGQH